jgi:hypothetical protein
MTHPAFEKPCNLTGRSANEWLKLAQQAQQAKCYVLAAKYYYNVKATALSPSKAILANRERYACLAAAAKMEAR